jgi:hypothetical protein
MKETNFIRTLEFEAGGYEEKTITVEIEYPTRLDCGDYECWCSISAPLNVRVRKVGIDAFQALGSAVVFVHEMLKVTMSVDPNKKIWWLERDDRGGFDWVKDL